jgi:ferric iron reductase protein FhuF
MAAHRDVGAPPDVAALFADLAGIGPFFAVGTGAPPGEGWVPVGALGVPDGPLADRVAAVRAALETDRRVAASIAIQGIAAQVVAPLFAVVAVHGVLPSADVAAALRWRSGGAGPWLWWAAEGRTVACPDPAVVGALVTRLLTPVVAAVRARVAVAEQVLWGNVASSLASARRLVAAARPEAAARAADVARHLLTTAPLARTATLCGPVPPDVGWTFHRRSCCLYYRVPGGATCGDCVLVPPRTPRIRYA